MRLPSLDEAQLLTMWVDLIVIAGVARLAGQGARRLGQPAVVGELLAGIVLGPSVLAHVWPGAEHQLVPTSPAAAAPLNTLAWLGVTLLLVLAGFDTDLTIIRRLGRPAALVSIGGLLVPFAAGLAVGAVLPDGFMGPHGSRIAFVLFIAVALSISSLPVIAKILDELGLMRRNFGQATVAVGMVNDLVGWLALGIISAVARTSHLSVASLVLPVGGIAVILAAAATIGRRGVDAVLRRTRRTGGGVDAVAVTLLVTFLLAAATQAVHSDGVLGAYIAGILIGRSRFFQKGMRQHLETVTLGVLAPLFFATAGLRLDLGSLATPEVGLWAGIILVVAVVAKLVGAYGGARVARLGRREGLALAVGLNCRGAVEVVIATVGLSLGVLDARAYTAIVLMAILTSVAAPPLLRRVVRDWRGDPEEQERLEREEAMARNLLVRPGRLLLPSLGGPDDAVAAEVLDAVWPSDVAATVLSVPDATGGHHDQQAVLAALGGRAVEVREVRAGLPDAILDEARLGYSVIGLGTSDAARIHRADGDAGEIGQEVVLSPVVDGLLGAAALPLVVVRLHGARTPAARGWAPTSGGRRPQRFSRILLPVAGSPASRTAEELAYHLADSTGAVVHVTHAVAAPSAPDDGAAGAADRVVRQALSHAGEHEVATRSSVRQAPAPGEAILAEADEVGADLIVLGTTARRLDGRVFLGHTVEQVLLHARATVVVVATPDALVTGGLTDRFDAPA